MEPIHDRVHSISPLVTEPNQLTHNIGNIIYVYVFPLISFLRILIWAFICFFFKKYEDHHYT
jgi:hypothetical protein